MGQVICAWCGEVIRTTPWDFDTHGICPGCKVKMDAEIDKMEEKERREKKRDLGSDLASVVILSIFGLALLSRMVWK